MRHVTRAARLLLAAALVLAAAGSGSAAPAPPEGPRRLSLDEAVALALRQNPDVALAEQRAEAARVARDQARDTARAMPDQAVTTLDQAKVKELYPVQAEGAARVAERAVEATRDGVRLAVEQAYFGAQLAREVVGVREQALALAERQLEQARLAYRAGVRARTDVLAAQAQVATARADLEAARKDAAVAGMELDRVLGLPLTTELELTTPLGDAGAEVAGEANPEAAVSKALARSVAVLKAEEDLAAARLARDLTARYFTPNVYAYRQAEADLRQKEVARDQERVTAELEVRKALLEIAAARARIAQQREAVSLSEEGLRLADLRYRAGVGTGTEVLDAQVRLSGARLAYAQAVFALRTALARYRNLVGE